MIIDARPVGHENNMAEATVFENKYAFEPAVVIRYPLPTRPEFRITKPPAVHGILKNRKAKLGFQFGLTVAWLDDHEPGNLGQVLELS